MIGMAGLAALAVGLLIGLVGVLGGGSAAGADTRAHADFSVVNSVPDVPAATAPTDHGLFAALGLDLRPLVFGGAVLMLVGALLLLQIKRRQAIPADDAGANRFAGWLAR